jgi:hypothetical protein
MARWKITPTWKKSVIEKQYWTKAGQPGYILNEIGWRWGEFFIETEDDTPPPLEAGVDMFDCGYDCDDWSTDDGCWEDNEIDVPDENDRQRLEEFLEENSVFDLEEDGWVMDECEMIIDCDLEIEKVKD